MAEVFTHPRETLDGIGNWWKQQSGPTKAGTISAEVLTAIGPGSFSKLGRLFRLGTKAGKLGTEAAQVARAGRAATETRSAAITAPAPQAPAKAAAEAAPPPKVRSVDQGAAPAAPGPG